ncbi:hypothetical protein EZV62_013682 [Acer yangbiense]|uniref:Replication protein A C-terminal domain-containing protein n=1 Tax=Acer yangbiense TaxID=1000413 RepID=A0A5C7I022_9ROSI|nr:hypothetical protein EZV62_013682 [Acer yangbiense]
MYFISISTKHLENSLKTLLLMFQFPSLKLLRSSILFSQPPQISLKLFLCLKFYCGMDMDLPLCRTPVTAMFTGCSFPCILFSQPPQIFSDLLMFQFPSLKILRSSILFSQPPQIFSLLKVLLWDGYGSAFVSESGDGDVYRILFLSAFAVNNLLILFLTASVVNNIGLEKSKMKYVKPLGLFDEVKQAGLCMLTADPGTKYTGLSLTDFDLTTAYPLKICNMRWIRKPHDLGSYLAKLFKNHKVGGLMVGYSPTEDRRLEIEHRERLVEWLNTAHASPLLKNLHFTLLDERRSTINAKLSNSFACKRELNKFAATYFTQTWLDHVRLGVLYTDGDNLIQLHLESVGDYWNYVHGGCKQGVATTQPHMVETSLNTPNWTGPNGYQTAPSTHFSSQFSMDGLKDTDQLILDYLQQPSSSERERGVHINELSQQMKIPEKKIMDSISMKV